MSSYASSPVFTLQYEDIIMGRSVFSKSLMSAKQDSTGWHRPKYVFSRFIADCAKSAGFDAIKYPSTMAGNECFNLVILNDRFSLKNGSELLRIFKYEHL